MRFFNSESRAKKAMQIYNLSAVAMSLNHWWTTPDSGSETAMDVSAHLMSYYLLGEEVDEVASFIGGFAINCVRLGAIYGGETLGGTTFSFMSNCVDALGHVCNAMLLLTNDASRTENRLAPR